MSNLDRFLHAMAGGISDVAAAIDAEYGEGESNKGSALRGYFSQIVAVAESAERNGGLPNWSELDGAIAIDLDPDPRTHNGYPTEDSAALDNIARRYQGWEDDGALSEAVAEAVMATGREVSDQGPAPLASEPGGPAIVGGRLRLPGDGDEYRWFDLSTVEEALGDDFNGPGAPESSEPAPIFCVDVPEREDGLYLFAEHDAADAFADALRPPSVATGPRAEDMPVNHDEGAENLIAAERAALMEDVGMPEVAEDVRRHKVPLSAILIRLAGIPETTEAKALVGHWIEVDEARNASGAPSFDEVSADSVEVGDWITLDADGEPDQTAEPRRVSEVRSGGTRTHFEFADGEPGASFAFDEHVWRRREETPKDCTGHYEQGHLSHNGDTCPIHEGSESSPTYTVVAIHCPEGASSTEPGGTVVTSDRAKALKSMCKYAAELEPPTPAAEFQEVAKVTLEQAERGVEHPLSLTGGFVEVAVSKPTDDAPEDAETLCPQCGSASICPVTPTDDRPPWACLDCDAEFEEPTRVEPAYTIAGFYGDNVQPYTVTVFTFNGPEAALDLAHKACAEANDTTVDDVDLVIVAIFAGEPRLIDFDVVETWPK